MFNISVNNIVTLSRGDSFSCPLFLNEGTDVKPVRHILETGEYVYFFLLRPNQPFENALVRKKLTKDNLNSNGDVVVSFQPEDTINLCPGTYFYEIRAHLLEGGKEIINTVVERTRFIIV